MSGILLSSVGGTFGTPVFIIQSTYDAARSWDSWGCCQDSSGNTYTAWNTSGILVITKHNALGVFQTQVSLTISLSYGEGYAMKVAPDGSLYIAGTDSGPALLKLNSNFTVAFYKKYNPANPYTLSYGSFSAIDIDSSGDVYCVGSGAWTVGQASQSHGWIYKIDSSGNTTWVREYNMGISHGYYGCALGADGFLYVCGSTVEYSGGAYLYYLELAKLSSSGTLTTHAKFIGPSYQSFCTTEYGGINARKLMFDSAGTTFYVIGNQQYGGGSQILGASYNTSLVQVGSYSRSKSGGYSSATPYQGVVTPTGAMYRVANFEFNNNNYSSTEIISDTETLRTMVNSASTLKGTGFNGMSFNPVNNTCYVNGSIRNTTGATNYRAFVFNFVTPETIPTTQIANSGIVLANDTMGTTSSSQTRTTITGASSSMTSTTSNGTQSSASTYPTLTTTIYS